MSKEEIEKAKGWLSALDIKSEFEAILKETLLQYIEQLEQENNKLNKIIDEMAKAWKQDDYRSIEIIKRYFEKKVEELK